MKFCIYKIQNVLDNEWIRNTYHSNLNTSLEKHISAGLLKVGFLWWCVEKQVACKFRRINRMILLN